MRRRHPLLHRLWRIALWVFPLVVLGLLARAAMRIDWSQVGAAIGDYDAGTLGLAALLTVTSYLVYCGYELGARRYAHLALSRRRTILIAFIAYAFALNIGALVGGAGLRLRMYSHAGLGMVAAARVVAFSVSTNWLGYVLLAGTLFASGAIVPPPRFAAGTVGLQALGFAMLMAVLAYLFACHRLHGRVFHVRGHHFRLPSVRLALVQFALAAVNWSLMATIVFVLLPAHADYPTVLGALLFAAVATAIAHVPAGLGVMEAVFIAFLGHRLGTAQVLAALLAYRVVYFLAPLLLAGTAYLLVEIRGRPTASAKSAP